MWKLKGGPYLLLALLLRTNSANCQLFSLFGKVPARTQRSKVRHVQGDHFFRLCTNFPQRVSKENIRTAVLQNKAVKLLLMYECCNE